MQRAFIHVGMLAYRRAVDDQLAVLGIAGIPIDSTAADFIGQPQPLFGGAVGNDH